MNTEHAAYQIADELGGLELLNAHYHKQNFSRHTHEGYTVGVIETGAQRFIAPVATMWRQNTALFSSMPMKCIMAVAPLKAAGRIVPCIQSLRSLPVLTVSEQQTAVRPISLSP
ncbi:hypothetical protein LFREDSHE_17210 [Shewanella baltica]